jgi:hypothetical protein
VPNTPTTTIDTPDHGYSDGPPYKGIPPLSLSQGISDEPDEPSDPPSGVTGNTPRLLGDYAVPPDVLSADADGDAVAEAAAWLDTAAPLTLDAKASTAAAIALVDAVTGMVTAHEGKRRGPKLRAKQTDAVGAIVGALLKNWSRPSPRSVFRSSKATSFTDSPIPYRQFTAAMQGLVGLGLVATQRGYRRAIDWGGGSKTWFGKAARYWPTAELLCTAATHGVTADTTVQHFTAPPPIRPPMVRAPVVVTSLKQTTGYRTGQGTKQQLSAAPLGPELERLRREVEEVNALAAQTDVAGCLPPRWKRVFTVNSLLGGRWIAVGKEGVYQTMSEDERPARITIDGQPVAELDVSACQLSIVHGLLRLPLPDGDLYAIGDYPRDVVKSWITSTLGKGSAVTRWSRKDPKAFTRNSAYDPKAVGTAVYRQYPFLRTPAQALAGPAGLDRMARIAKPETLLTHRLMNIEAEAMTLAMRALRNDWLTLALPLHDGLLVQRSAASEAEDTLRWAFQSVAGVRVRVTVDPPLARDEISAD